MTERTSIYSRQKARERMRLRIKQRIRQKAFKNEQISLHKLKKDYEKYKLPPNPRRRVYKE